MFKVLVSACLMGQAVRYDGNPLTSDHDILARWSREGRLVPICPEVAGGLGVPRPPAEIQEHSGAEVLAGKAEVHAKTGENVTQAFVRGAQAVLAAARRQGAVMAILTEKSPSCGSSYIYQGRFDRAFKEGEGVTTALLRQEGLVVFSQHQLEEADAWLRARETTARPPTSVPQAW